MTVVVNAALPLSMHPFHHVFAGSEGSNGLRRLTSTLNYVSKHGWWNPERKQEARFQENLLVFKLRSLCEQLGISIRETKQDAKLGVD